MSQNENKQAEPYEKIAAELLKAKELTGIPINQALQNGGFRRNNALHEQYATVDGFLANIAKNGASQMPKSVGKKNIEDLIAAARKIAAQRDKESAAKTDKLRKIINAKTNKAKTAKTEKANPASNSSPKITVSNKPVFTEKARMWHNAFIGKTGSGKTYAARGEVEDLLTMGRQVVIIDPTGAWPGLRSTPEGNPSGLPIAIFGGAHGDRVLTPEMAPALGRIAGTTTQSMILDLSGISLELEDQREIAYQFLRNLYRLNRKPIHLVIDEADEFCPQELSKDTKDLRTLVARIMARGRSLGFRCTLITQRPAKIDKNSLSQIESMAVLRVTAPQDRNAIVDWFSDKGGANRKEILSGLGSLETGEGWVFTGLDGTYEHRRFRKIKTYDSSSTPTDEHGNARDIDTGTIDLAAVDEAVTYPEETDEMDLEKAIARRRNLESENKRLRIRVLQSDARYEVMRKVFVQFRRAIDEVLANDEVEAVEYADLLLLRNEVAQEAGIDVIELNDVKGVPDIQIESELPPINPENPFAQAKNPMPADITAKLTDTERSIIIEASRRKGDIKDLSLRSGTSIKRAETLIAKLEAEGSLLNEEGAFSATPSGFARLLNLAQFEALNVIINQPESASDVNSRTVAVLTRSGFLDHHKQVTAIGRQAYEISRKTTFNTKDQ